MPTKNSHMWTQLERIRNTQKQSLNITSRHQDDVPTKHVNLHTPPWREYCMLFAEFSSQGGRSTPTSLQSPFPSPHATFLCSPRKPWSVTCGVLLLRDSLSHHLRALSTFVLRALDCASALDHVCRLQPLYLLTATHQTSIITTTGPAAHHSRCRVLHSFRTPPIIQLANASLSSIFVPRSARILFRATANRLELSFTQCLLMPQVTRLQMSHPTTTNPVNHASLCRLSS